MAKGKVDITGINTSELEVLSNEEMNDLFFKLNSGDNNVKEKLVNGNLKLVLSLLKKYVNRTDNMDDLFQIGCIGLIKAVDNFDLSHGVKFSTYAVPMILGEVKRYLRDNNSVRIARSIKDTAYKVAKEIERLTSLYGKEPSTSMLCDSLNLSEYELNLALNSLKESVSMFEPIYSDGGDVIYLCDQLEDKSNNNYCLEDKISLNDALSKLKDKEKFIINSRYVYGKTQMELSEELGISQAQISRLEKSGLDNIKRMIL